MAITGTFVADFEMFYGATAAAEDALASLVRKSDETGAALDTMTSSFDAGAIAGETDVLAGALDNTTTAAGGVAKELQNVTTRSAETTKGLQDIGDKGAPAVDKAKDATAKLPPEVNKSTTALGALNSKVGEVVAGFTIAKLFEAGATAAINFTREVFENADAIADAASKYRMTVEAVQAFQTISGETGVSFQAIAGAARTLSANLAEGDSSTIAALTALGIKASDLKGLSIDETFFAVGRALATVATEGEQTRLALDLGGGKMVESLGAINSNMDEINKNAPKMSAEMIAALDGMKLSTDRFFAAQKFALTESVGLWTLLITQGPRAAQQAYDEMHGYANPKIKEAAQFLEQQDKAQRGVTLSAQEMAKIEKELTTSTETAIKDTGALTKLRDQLFSRDLIQRAEDYVEALGGVENLTKLTDDKKKELVKTLNDALKVYGALGETAPRAMRDILEATQTELLPVLRSFSTEAAGMFTTFKASVEQIRPALAEVGIDWKALGGTSREELQATADAAALRYADVLATSEHFTGEQIANFAEVAASAQTAADNWGMSFINEFSAVNTAAGETKGVLEGVVSTMNTLQNFQGTLPNVNPITGEGMNRTDPRVQGYLREGYTLGEATALSSGVPTNIGRPSGYWTAEGYMSGRPTNPFDIGIGGVGAPSSGGNTNVTVNVGNLLSNNKDLANAVQSGMVAGAMANGTRL